MWHVTCLFSVFIFCHRLRRCTTDRVVTTPEQAKLDNDWRQMYEQVMATPMDFGIPIAQPMPAEAQLAADETPVWYSLSLVSNAFTLQSPQVLPTNKGDLFKPAGSQANHNNRRQREEVHDGDPDHRTQRCIISFPGMITAGRSVSSFCFSGVVEGPGYNVPSTDAKWERPGQSHVP